MRVSSGGKIIVVFFCFVPISAAQTVRVDISPAKAVSFDPDKALGTSLDILPEKQFERVFAPETIRQSLSAGWGPITYRQNTELSIGAWHWNPAGSWSDPQRHSGYFTGSADPSSDSKNDLRRSYGYPLPHRGNTRNNGASHGYSRLTDGDPASYWKSNPYLTANLRTKRIACIRNGSSWTSALRSPLTRCVSPGPILTQPGLSCSIGRAATTL